MDIFGRFARDPACLVAIDAADGGRWNSGFKQSTLRNFAVNPSNASTGEPVIALRSVLHPTTGMAYGHDFRLEAAIKIIAPAVPGSYSVMYQSAGRLQLFFDVRSDGQQRFAVASSAISGASIYLPYVADRTGTHTIGLEVVGNILRFTLDGVIYEATGVRVDASGADPNRVININFNGTVSSMILTDLTASSVLYNSGAFYNSDGIYPSTMPRNFAIEPATRYDLRRAFADIGTHDFRYTIKFTIFDNSSPSYAILGVSGQAYSIGAVKINATTTNFRLTAFSNGPGGVNKGDLFTNGTHTLIIEVIGKQVSIVLDGTAILSWNAGTGTRIAIAEYNSISNLPGTIEEEYIIDLTTGESVFSYPTFEKKCRLITDSNCYYGNGVIEAASSAAPWIIKYAGTAPVADYSAVIDTTAAVIAQVRKSGVTTTYTNGVSGGTLPYLNLATSTLSGAYGTKMRHFLLDDRALSIGEIQLLR